MPMRRRAGKFAAYDQAEKNKPVESILLENERRLSSRLRQSLLIEEGVFFSVCYDGQVRAWKEIR